ncbi:E3 ubiquitin-protein ligase [Melia azedarach]|uniref:E3 ubiquitin-protein ligase n=1 Tax=Melia azedarach TaxID=155640 RepID=A0ACC1X6P9_MELAZ|nr:E3 ubiquitin-protein ligase [Melia azedarach]
MVRGRRGKLGRDEAAGPSRRSIPPTRRRVRQRRPNPWHAEEEDSSEEPQEDEGEDSNESQEDKQEDEEDSEERQEDEDDVQESQEDDKEEEGGETQEHRRQDDSGECQEDKDEEDNKESQEDDDESRADNGGKRKRSETVESPQRNKQISTTLNDSQAFDCPICSEHFTIPVHQCENGHTSCSSCSTKLKNKCPICHLAFSFRNSAVERRVESSTVVCKNSEYGCKEKMNSCKKRYHERKCCYEPCSCPLSDCNYIGSLGGLCQHFRDEHKNSAAQFQFSIYFRLTFNVDEKYLVLREKTHGILFTLNITRTDDGNKISLNCIAPSSIQLHISYEIEARDLNMRSRIVTFKSSMLGRNERPADAEDLHFLLVPSYFFFEGQFALEIFMWKPSLVLKKYIRN